MASQKQAHFHVLYRLPRKKKRQPITCMYGALSFEMPVYVTISIQSKTSWKKKITAFTISDKSFYLGFCMGKKCLLFKYSCFKEWIKCWYTVVVIFSCSMNSMCIWGRDDIHSFFSLLNVRQIRELYFKLSNILIKIKSLRNVLVELINECVWCIL